MSKAAFFIVMAALPLTVGCTTTGATHAQIAECQRMRDAMGVNTLHDHGEGKGQGMSSMNMSHGRCQQILSQQN
jgi:hypothetical protein